jgi:hypothetical protein
MPLGMLSNLIEVYRLQKLSLLGDLLLSSLEFGHEDLVVVLVEELLVGGLGVLGGNWGFEGLLLFQYGVLALVFALLGFCAAAFAFFGLLRVH